LNIRDFASINELAVTFKQLKVWMTVLIKKEYEKSDRFHQLQEIALYQLEILNNKNSFKSLKKLAEDTFIEEQKKTEKKRTKR